MHHFERGLKSKGKQIAVGHVYSNFQEMYQRAVKVARIMSQTKIENLEKGLPKRKFVLGGSSS